MTSSCALVSVRQLTTAAPLLACPGFKVTHRWRKLLSLSVHPGGINGVRARSTSCVRCSLQAVRGPCRPATDGASSVLFNSYPNDILFIPPVSIIFLPILTTKIIRRRYHFIQVAKKSMLSLYAPSGFFSGCRLARSRSIRKSPSLLSITRSISLTISRTMDSSSTCSLTNHCIKVCVA
jgi:hypothetical protein